MRSTHLYAGVAWRRLQFTYSMGETAPGTVFAGPFEIIMFAESDLIQSIP